MKKVQIPKKLESSAFSKVLADKLTKGPIPTPSASVSKPVKDPPEIKNNQKENSDVPPSWPLPSVAKSRPRGPTRRPPSRTKLSTASTTSASVDVEKPSVGGSEKPSTGASLDTAEASSNSNLVKTDAVTTKRKDKSPASSTNPDQISGPTKQLEEKIAKPTTVQSTASSAASGDASSDTSSTVPSAARSTVPSAAPSTVPSAARSTVPRATPSTVPSAASSTAPSAASSTAPRANVSKMARSFFDSESDDDIGAGDNNKRGGKDTPVSSAIPKGGASTHEEPRRENPPKTSSGGQGAPAPKSIKPLLAKGLFDDDEEDDDLSMFRSNKSKKS
ncbi:hypothetical protein TELCIR_07407 [Teladorsagia circumcincta]|uniref:Uncharacterized protein n=1 Tax=Teladorsagia circumcincta TaxID=45464 RepID=A0A2G9UKE2_TELCI|nr:hypothetical protein TELCIR_07407 [Teladorsagia circumcincta]